ncbi:MAG: PDDEXK nuclease domain-containing protein [Prevotella sp.]|nr:PDDEXK nuclease domain-containing protein [Prevotella sp.]
MLERISRRYVEGQAQAVRSVNEVIIETNWSIGQYIVEYEQGGNPKAKYGSKLLVNLSRDLTLLHGRGFSRPNLNNMRLFYLRYPICQKLSDKLSWSHYCELIKISDDTERSFYFQQNILENWSVTELRRQMDSGLFLRLALSKEKEKVLSLAKNGQQIAMPEDIVKDVYVFEFLKIPEPYHISETDLETRLLDNLQSFLLELGKGFTFVGRQYRMTIDNVHYRVDLVFYHRILRTFVLLDLKINSVKHDDIGQMNMYMGYFAKEENYEGDNPPIGIILTKEKNELLVEYATYGMNSQLFVSKYQLYLPDKEELRKVISLQFENNE